MPYEPVNPPAEPKSKLSPVNTLIIVSGLLVGLFIYTSKNPSVPVEPNTPVDVDTRIGGVVTVIRQADPAKVKPIGELFLAMGDVISRAEPVDTEILRAWIVDSQTYLVAGTDLAGGIGLGPELNKLFEEVFGLDSRDLSQAEMQQMAKLFTDIGHVCGVK